MTLSTNPIDLDELRATFNDLADVIDAERAAGDGDYEVEVRLASLAAADNLLARSFAWTQQDEADLISIFVHATAGGLSVVKARLTVDGIQNAQNARQRAAYAKYLGGHDAIDVSVTTIAGTADARDRFDEPGSIYRVRLLEGVRYRLELLHVSGATPVTGPLLAGVQLRGMRRGGSGGRTFVPNAFRSGGYVDVDRVNENVQALVLALKEVQARRYSYGVAIVDLSGVDLTVAALRQIPLRQLAAGRTIDVVATELVVSNGTASEVFSLALNDSDTWPGLEVTGGGANVEDAAICDTMFRVDSDTADTVLEVTAAGAGTITRGYLVLHTRCDRWDQGDGTLTDPKQSPLNAQSSHALSTLNDIETALDDIAEAGENADSDQRIHVFVGRNIAATSQAFRIQGGEIAYQRVRIYAVVAATSAARVNVATPTGASVSCDVTGAGVAARATNDAALNPLNGGDDPEASGDDTVVTLSRLSGADTVLLLIAVVYSY